MSIPTQPRASTREHAVVGIDCTSIPINDLVLPWLPRKVETRGVRTEGKGTATFRLDVRVMVDGVWVARLGDGGNTKSVWKGVAAGTTFDPTVAVNGGFARS